MNICFIDRLGSPYDGSTPYKRALGGSESAVVYMARELVKLGNDVTVYNDCEELDAKSGKYDGVHYRPYSSMELHSDWYDVAVISRSTVPFAGFVPATHKVLWMHDTFCEGDENLEFYTVQNLIDEIWTLSDWHTSYISQCTHGHRRMMEVLKRKIWVTRNGVNLWQDVELKNKDRNSFVFNAAVSKGMETLLEDVWPKVKERIVDARLTIIGGAYPLKKNDVQNDKLAELDKKYSGQNDVTFTGLLNQKQITNHLSHAGFMIYPQSHPETYGISTVESLAYGTPVISGRFGAMEETAIDDACYLMDYPVDSNVLYSFNKEHHVAHFVDMVVNARNNDYLWQQKCNAALKVREICEWDKVALQWQQHLYKKLGLFLSKEEYRKVTRINHRVHEIFNKRWSNPEEWAYYPEEEKTIHVVVPFYNASQYLKKCIESIQSQNYENYEVHLIDDDSEDSSMVVCQFMIDKDDKFHLHSNDKNQGALANQVMCINEIIDAGVEDIIILIDGDDALANDNNVFKKINRLYHDGAEMTYGSCWSMADNIPLVAQEYPKHVFEQKSFRDYRFPWNFPYTHLRTFTVEAFNRIPDSDLRDSDGAYYRAGGDGALFYGLIEHCSRDGVRAVRDILYQYNDLNPNNDYKVNSEEQTRTANKILAKRPMPDGKTERVTLKQNEIEVKPNDFIKVPKRILIAIPTDRNIHPETFKAIYDLEIPDGYDVDFQYFYGYRVDQVRNLIAHWGIQYDYLFCVDHDIAFPKDALKKLLSHDKDMVTGLYRQRKADHVLEIYGDTPRGQENIRIEELDIGLNEISACGFGCVLIKSKVLKDVGYPQFEYHPALRIEDTVSEDVDFCNKAKKKGFSIWVDSTIKCKHYGMVSFEVI